MSWIEVRATLPPLTESDISPFVEIFRSFGIENTQEEGGDVLGCIVDVPGSSDIVTELSEVLRRAGALSVSAVPFEEQNWAEVWKQFFKPRRVGERFVVRPTWEEFASEPGDLVIVLDPGEAFGTGDHPTTRLCLELLEQCALPGKVVADIGCGSGILSIGAKMLGAAKVLAVDIEPPSVEITKANALLNNVEIDVRLGEGINTLFGKEESVESRRIAAQAWEQDERPLAVGHASFSQASADVSRENENLFDIVVSNIISAVLIRLAPDVRSALRPDGRWIVSGIIHANWPDVFAAAERSGFSLLDRREEGDWCAALFLCSAKK